jgi:hypothetical protein
VEKLNSLHYPAGGFAALLGRPENNLPERRQTSTPQ